MDGWIAIVVRFLRFKQIVDNENLDPLLSDYIEVKLP